ncbi:Lipoyltransferase and lipoate-protein ligase [Atractiella rhizophila]|nr:Lipoyltransferase and lipoate-protein ligase [Atractiella rhizophila]
MPVPKLHRIFSSKSHNPWFNLSFEDWLFRKSDPSTTILYMYRNDPCVVIGRNQNPWKEIDLRLLSKLNIPFIRRKSGGGTVYHDLGNTNYCVLTSRATFDRNTNAEMVARALKKKFGIQAFVNERHDVCLTTQRAYHHGSMLLHADLSSLRGLLSPLRDRITTKGVLSVSSKVTNLRSYNPQLDHDTFVSAVADEFRETNGTDDKILEVDETCLPEGSEEYINTTIQELQSWEWQYGQTPEFTHDFHHDNIEVRLTSKHGLITAVDVKPDTSSALISAPPQMNDKMAALGDELVDIFVGQLYGERLQKVPDTPSTKDIVDFIYSKM